MWRATRRPWRAHGQPAQRRGARPGGQQSAVWRGRSAPRPTPDPVASISAVMCRRPSGTSHRTAAYGGGVGCGWAAGACGGHADPRGSAGSSEEKFRAKVLAPAGARTPTSDGVTRRRRKEGTRHGLTDESFRGRGQHARRGDSQRAAVAARAPPDADVAWDGHDTGGHGGLGHRDPARSLAGAVRGGSSLPAPGGTVGALPAIGSTGGTRAATAGRRRCRHGPVAASRARARRAPARAPRARAPRARHHEPGHRGPGHHGPGHHGLRAPRARAPRARAPRARAPRARAPRARAPRARVPRVSDQGLGQAYGVRARRRPGRGQPAHRKTAAPEFRGDRGDRPESARGPAVESYRKPMRDREIVAAIVAGDPAGLDAAYDRYAAGLFAYCRSLLTEPADAADAVQDTFIIAAAKAFRAPRPGAAPPLAVRGGPERVPAPAAVAREPPPRSTRPPR